MMPAGSRREALTAIARIRPGQEAALEQIIQAGSACLDRELHRPDLPVHFMSLTVVPAREGAGAGWLVIEANADGRLDEFLQAIDAPLATLLVPILAACESFDAGAADTAHPEALVRDFLRAHNHIPMAYYAGAPGRTARQVGAEEALVATVEKLRAAEVALDVANKGRKVNGRDPWASLDTGEKIARLRKQLSVNDDGSIASTPPTIPLAVRLRPWILVTGVALYLTMIWLAADRWCPGLLRPTVVLTLPSLTWLEVTRSVLCTLAAAVATIVAVLIVAAIVALLWHFVLRAVNERFRSRLRIFARRIVRASWRLALLFGLVFGMVALLWPPSGVWPLIDVTRLQEWIGLAFALPGVLVVALFLLARVLECSECRAPDEGPAEVARHPDILRAEYRYRRLYNHFASVTDIKRPVALRGLLLRAALWTVDLGGRYLYNRGTLAGTPHIRFARWVIFDRGRRLLFLSNYAGSWDGYLSDFALFSNQGLNAIWTNTVIPGRSWPRTQWWLWHGASDDVAFKSYAGKSQIPTGYWYVRHPRLTTTDIIRNTAIRAGLAKTAGAASPDQYFVDIG